MKYFSQSLARTIFECFKGFNWLWHILAILLTLFLVLTKADWYYFLSTRSISLNYLFFPAIVLGGILPIVIPLGLIALGYLTKNKRAEIFGWAIGQAVIIGSIISSSYKFFTGRIQPNLFDIVNNITDIFKFGFYEHGIFWGWPSSHTTIAFAMAVLLIQLFPKNKLIRYFSIIYAFYIGIGVSFSIHWFSDFVAGAIIGSIIGVVVAKNYKNKIDEVK